MKQRASFAVAVIVALLMFAFPPHVRAQDHHGDGDDSGAVQRHHDHDRGFDRDSDRHHHDRDFERDADRHHHDRDFDRDADRDRHDRDFDRDSDRDAWHHDNGLHKGWYKHRHRDADDEDYDDDQGGGYVAPSTYGPGYRRQRRDRDDYPYLCEEDRDACRPNPYFHGTVPALPAALQPVPRPVPNLLANQSLLTRHNNLAAQEQQARQRYNQAVKNGNRKAAIYWLTRIQKLDAQMGALNRLAPTTSLVNPTSGLGSAANTLAPVVQQMMTH